MNRPHIGAAVYLVLGAFRRMKMGSKMKNASSGVSLRFHFWDEACARREKGLSTFSVCVSMQWFSLVCVDPTVQWAPGPQPMEWRSRKLMGAWEYRFPENCVRAIWGMRDFHRFRRSSLISSSVGLARAGAHSFATTSTALDLSSPCNQDHVSVYSLNASSSLEMNDLPPWRKSVILSCHPGALWVVWDNLGISESEET